RAHGSGDFAPGLREGTTQSVDTAPDTRTLVMVGREIRKPDSMAGRAVGALGKSFVQAVQRRAGSAAGPRARREKQVQTPLGKGVAMRSTWMKAASVACLALLAGAAHGQVVISQVYGGGGNSGATYRNDFVELFNKGASPVALTGW